MQPKLYVIQTGEGLSPGGGGEGTDLPRGFRTRTASTRQYERCCGTTWHGPTRPRTWPCSQDTATVQFQGRRNLTRKQQRSSAASCCLHLHNHTECEDSFDARFNLYDVVLCEGLLVPYYRCVLGLSPRTASVARWQLLCRSVVGSQA